MIHTVSVGFCVWGGADQWLCKLVIGIFFAVIFLAGLEAGLGFLV